MNSIGGDTPSISARRIHTPGMVEVWGETTIPYAARTATVMTTPAGTQAGDLLLFIGDLFQNGFGGTMNPPDDSWNAMPSTPNRQEVGGCAIFIWYKIAGVAEPASYTFSHDAGASFKTEC